MRPLSSIYSVFDSHRRLSVAVCIIAALAVLIFLAVVDPMETWTPKCVFHSLTGLDCPGCGAQRAIHAATQGRWAEAWAANPVLWPGLAIAALYAVSPRRLNRVLYHPAAILAIALAIAAWWIGRNL